MLKFMTDTDGEGIENIIELIREEATLPKYHDPYDGGMDLYAANEKPITIFPGDIQMIPLGFKIQTPVNFLWDIRPRSSVSANTLLRVANSPGTIDCNYRGEVMVLLHHTGTETHDFFEKTLTIKGAPSGYPKEKINPILQHNYGYTIYKGDKIAQMVLLNSPRAVLVVGNVDNGTSDATRNGGFGSSDAKTDIG